MAYQYTAHEAPYVIYFIFGSDQHREYNTGCNEPKKSFSNPYRYFAYLFSISPHIFMLV